MKQGIVWKYQTVSAPCFHSDIGAYTGYGLALDAAQICAPNLFTNQLDAESAARFLNRHQVSPVHFWDVIEDILS